MGMIEPFLKAVRLLLKDFETPVIPGFLIILEEFCQSFLSLSTLRGCFIKPSKRYAFTDVLLLRTGKFAASLEDSQGEYFRLRFVPQSSKKGNQRPCWLSAYCKLRKYSLGLDLTALTHPWQQTHKLRPETVTRIGLPIEPSFSFVTGQVA